MTTSMGSNSMADTNKRTLYEEGPFLYDRALEVGCPKYPIIDEGVVPPSTASPEKVDYPHEENRATTQYQPNTWLRWQYLVLYGLLIAIISAVIGGFAAKAIVQNATSTVPLPSETNHSPSPAACNKTTTPTPSPEPNEFEKYCSKGYTQPLKTLFNNPYYFNCSRDWYFDEIAPLFATNTSVCIETCRAYNLKLKTNECIGASFHPLLLDLTKAKLFHDAPVNCWLKKGTAGLQPQSGGNDPILSICLKEDCSPVD